MLHECINDLYDSGFCNDKLPLIFLENKNAKIAVKTPTGISNRESINNIVMQGTVWGSIFCTATMDKLGKFVYNNDDLVYKYKGVVDTPTLGMVDDIMSIQKCSQSAIKTNAVINAFIETKNSHRVKANAGEYILAKKRNMTETAQPLKCMMKK